jgi:hypothetical protein
MRQLSEKEIDFIEADLIRKGIVTKSVRDNLLDHICILFEEQAAMEEDFITAYNNLIRRFYLNDIREIELGARLAVLSRRHLILTKSEFFVSLLLMMVVPIAVYLLSFSDLQKDVWGPVLAYATWPLCSLIVVFFIPDKLDPPLSKNSRIAIGFRPLISIID